MARSFNYSKWDNIELSDDESDLHPNIDKESWFRMKHRSRLEREAREDVEIQEMKKQNDQDSARIQIIAARLSKKDSGDEDAEFEDFDALQGEKTELEQRIAAKNKRIDQIMEKRSWNIDNICHVKEEKSYVNSATVSSLKADDFEPTGITEAVFAKNAANEEAAGADLPNPAPAANASAEAAISPPSVPSSTSSSAVAVKGPTVLNPKKTQKQAALSYNDYVLTHEVMLEHYSEIQGIEDTKEYLFKHSDILLHEHSQSYLLLSCLEDEMNGKHKRMKLVCRQSQILSHVTELAVSMKRDPRDVVLPFFARIQEPEYYNGFIKSVEDFIERIKKRAVEKRKEMDMERRREAMGDEVPLGPGGLHPLDVLEQLPASMREAFDKQDLPALHQAVASMKPSEAKKWMKMCVDSGLWVPSNANEFEALQRDDDDDAAQEDEEETEEAGATESSS